MKKRLTDGRIVVGVLDEIKVISKGAEKAPEEPVKAEEVVEPPKPKKAKKKSTKK